jgi:membrane-associated phospholipid phosphatase
MGGSLTAWRGMRRPGLGGGAGSHADVRARHLSVSLVAPLPFLVHGAWCLWRHAFHWENAAIIAVAIVLSAGGARTRKLLAGVYPLGLTGVMYTSMKPFEDVGVSPSTVHLCDLRAVEAALFGFDQGGTRITLHDWLQAHPSALLDRLCAIPYGTFIFVIVACALWLYLRDTARMVRFGWCYFAVNLAGFVTYHLYPAAPPWYFHAHGCAVDMAARASEGANLARVDAWLGTTYFAAMYGRASDVFGAMPSLHVAYALLVVVFGWPTWGTAGRVASSTFFLLMCFGAVYLDHHWVLDVIAGAAYCLVVVGVSEGAVALRGARRSHAGTIAGAACEEPSTTRQLV